MQGHAVSNVIPVVASNRVGHEPGPGRGQSFYGSSFIADHRGDLVAELGREEEGVITAELDLDFLATHRAAWGFFRDRRTDLYEAIGPAKVFGGRPGEPVK
jgi:N-carbamoylputrescine amidase